MFKRSPIALAQVKAGNTDKSDKPHILCSEKRNY